MSGFRDDSDRNPDSPKSLSPRDCDLDTRWGVRRFSRSDVLNRTPLGFVVLFVFYEVVGAANEEHNPTTIVLVKAGLDDEASCAARS